MLLITCCYNYHSIDSVSVPKCQVQPDHDYTISPSNAQSVTLPATQPAAPQPAMQLSQTVGRELAQPTTLPEPQLVSHAPPHKHVQSSQAVSRQSVTPPQALHEIPTPRQASTSQPATLPEGQSVSPLYAQLQTLPQGQPVAPVLQPTSVMVHDDFLSEVYTHWVS
jgi:hypothetical protein